MADFEPNDADLEPADDEKPLGEPKKFRFWQSWRIRNPRIARVAFPMFWSVLGASIGFIIGSIVPVIGNGFGAAIGASTGLFFSSGTEFAFSKGLSHTTIGLKVLSATGGGMAIGALVGSVVPGIGTLVGLTVGGSIGLLTAVITSIPFYISKHYNQVRLYGDVKADAAGTFMGVTSGMAIGALVGSLVPGIGTLIGLGAGALFGAAVSLSGVGIGRLAAHRGSNGFHGGLVTGAGIGGLAGSIVGAVVGTVLFPGLGTLAGMAACAGIGMAIGGGVMWVTSLAGVILKRQTNSFEDVDHALDNSGFNPYTPREHFPLNNNDPDNFKEHPGINLFEDRCRVMYQVKGYEVIEPKTCFNSLFKSAYYDVDLLGDPVDANPQQVIQYHSSQA